jgi:mannose-6-phosphate isomerase
LTPFWALNGFRSVRDILSGVKYCCPKGLEKERGRLESNPTDDGLKRFFESIMMLNPDKKEKVIEEALRVAEKHCEKDAAYDWMIKLHQAYPSDIGIISPVILNLILLQPGQAMFLPSGQLHAYLNGLGMELMANSDNVLRGGLTPKHVDVQELLKVLRFEESKVTIYSPEPESEIEYVYPSDAEEFVLSVISIKKGDVFESIDLNGVEILFCAAGPARIKNLTEKASITLKQGASAIVPAAAGTYRIEGDTTIYKAAVPI